MTTAIRVTPDQLRDMSTRVKTAADQTQNEFNSMRSTIGSMGSTWAGNASMQYQALMEEWSTAERKVQEALRGISALLSQAGDAYDRADGYIAGTFRR